MTLTNLQKAEHDALVLDATLSVIEAAINAHNTIQIDEADCDIYIERVKLQLNSYEEVYRRILNTLPADAAPYTAAYNGRSTRVFKAYGFLKTLKRSFPQSSVPSSSSQPQHVRLPKIELPKFKGSYEEWPSFSDKFTNQVTKNNTISDADKLSYLLSCVEGEAKKLISSFTITDLHFKEAWDVLLHRYDNKKEIVQSLVRRLANQNDVKTENVTHLQTLQNTTNECLRSLKVLGRDTDRWDDLIVVIIADKMDAETRSEWSKYHRATDPPTFKELDEFLTHHVRSLLARGPITGGKQPQQRAGTSSGKSVSTHHTSTSQQCVVCSGNHYIFHCERFKNMNSNDRNTLVKEKSLCFNCLRSGHSVRECKSTHKCKKCNKGHNTLLHRDQKNSSTDNQSSGESSHTTTAAATTTAVAVPSSSSGYSNHVLLKTIKLIVIDCAGVSHVCKTALDECSQSSYITESCASALGLTRTPVDITVNGISGATVTRLKHAVHFLARSRISEATTPVSAYVMGRITRDLERVKCNNKSWNHISDLELADPDYSEAGRIDILLGAEVAASILRDGIRQGIPGNSPTAQNTIFGWVLFGSVQLTPASQFTSCHSSVDINSTLQRFWELENIPKVKHFTKEEAECETHFINTVSRNPEGRYICRLPFNEKKSQLGGSKEQALRRFSLLEKRFKRQPVIKEQYVKFMREYLEMNHMELVPNCERDKPSSYYLPHHCVTREDSTTTKLRVVFDGSAKTTTGISLNDALLVGPVVQDDLFTILLRFRMKPIALKADIAKMYRQFILPKEDADYLRIIWREQESDPLQIYRLTTVTYGTAAAPYQATRCLQQLAVDEGGNFPAAAEALTSSTYVDDLLTCAATPNEAIKLHEELNNITKKAGMCIRKWATNSQKVLDRINPELREKENISFDLDNTIKALGILWNPASDSFQFRVNSSPPQSVTKRVILAELARVFDPLGWLSPVTINAKIIFQELWKCKLDWDEAPTEGIIEKWNMYQSSLSSLQQVVIPRCIITAKPQKLQLHAFCDSSYNAYAACVYLRVVHEDKTVSVNLVTAKTRVAPIKQQSIPRLELCGADLVCELIDNVKESMKLNCEVFGWTDSTIVLHWLASYPGRWKTFVANRVSKIQGIIPFESWSHVISEENPADCASRGISAHEIIDNKLWWHGPSWLNEYKFQPHSSSIPSHSSFAAEEVEEKKTTMLCTSEPSNELFHRYSSLIKLQRITAMMLRFGNNCRPQDKEYGAISTTNLEQAMIVLVKLVQQHHFSSEIGQLNSGVAIKAGKLSQLNPFLDKAGVLRVGGRLHNSKEPEDTKHPIILPHNHQLTTLIIRHHHHKNMHSGLKLTCASILQQFWILRARDTVRHIIRKCIICRKHRAELSQQLMGSLPSARVNPSRPFTECGLDYAGPFNVKVRLGRGQRTEKVYFCIFVCLATKAIHLESVDSLSTADFIACFKRFVARRGIPSTLYSDNGTNFVGADNELKLLLEQSKSLDQGIINRELSSQGTNWIFNPPSAPHQGGLWEAGVKAVKYHLRRVIGSASPTKREFDTLLCMVEACVNSRPLCAASSDSSDLNVLTPGHFLIGAPLNAIPEADLTHIQINRLSRWQHTQQLFQHFWRRWRGEYLTSLQQRFKWRTKRDNLQVNDLVIIKEDNVPPMKWKMGRIISTHPGHDGLVRVVTVKTATNEIQRPIAKLCPILSNDD